MVIALEKAIIEAYDSGNTAWLGLLGSWLQAMKEEDDDQWRLQRFTRGKRAKTEGTSEGISEGPSLVTAPAER